MSRDIELLHPELQEIIQKIQKECDKKGLKMKTTDTLRTEKEQDDLYAKGRTSGGSIVTWVKYPYSNHNWGIAVDFCRNDGQGAYNDYDNFFKKVGYIAKYFGLEWGGDWDTPDKPHLQFTKYGSSFELFKKYEKYENFKKTWGEEKDDKFLFVDRKYVYGNVKKTFKVISNGGQNYVKIRDISGLLNKKIDYDKYEKITNLDDKFIEKIFENQEEKKHIDCIINKDISYTNTRELASLLGYETKYDAETGKIYFQEK